VQLSRALAPLGITHSDYSLLATVRGMGQVGVKPSQRELADASGLEPMHVSKLARALEDRSLLRRDQHPDDPRAVQITLTDHGETVVDEARVIVTRLDEERLRSIGGTEGPRADELRSSLMTLLHASRAEENHSPP
jgi:MarR family transcriptional regulator, organic hydroperoxide resistance regulator